MNVMKGATLLGVALALLLAPIDSTADAAAECKPVLICEGIDVGLWEFRVCVKIQLPC
jgi:hypothetical protein